MSRVRIPYPAPMLNPLPTGLSVISFPFCTFSSSCGKAVVRARRTARSRCGLRALARCPPWRCCCAREFPAKAAQPPLSTCTVLCAVRRLTTDDDIADLDLHVECEFPIGPRVKPLKDLAETRNVKLFAVLPYMKGWGPRWLGAAVWGFGPGVPLA